MRLIRRIMGRKSIVTSISNVGMMRQWLNEDRIRDGKRFVTNEELLHWLEMEEKRPAKGSIILYD